MAQHLYVPVEVQGAFYDVMLTPKGNGFEVIFRDFPALKVFADSESLAMNEAIDAIAHELFLRRQKQREGER